MYNLLVKRIRVAPAGPHTYSLISKTQIEILNHHTVWALLHEVKEEKNVSGVVVYAKCGDTHYVKLGHVSPYTRKMLINNQNFFFVWDNYV